MTAYEVRISDWSSDVCSSDLVEGHGVHLCDAACAERRHHVGKAVVDQRQPPVGPVFQRAPFGNGVGIAIKGPDMTRAGGKGRARIAARAEGAVHQNVTGVEGKPDRKSTRLNSSH